MICSMAGSFYEIDVIDVARQEDNKMMMWNWTEYFSNPARSKILNVISLEFSKTELVLFLVDYIRDSKQSQLKDCVLN